MNWEQGTQQAKLTVAVFLALRRLSGRITGSRPASPNNTARLEFCSVLFMVFLRQGLIIYPRLPSDV